MSVAALIRSTAGMMGPLATALALVPDAWSPTADPRRPAGPGGMPTQLWVLAEPDTIVEYSLATFAAKRSLKVPRRLLEHPDGLSVNASGQMVFLPSVGTQWEGGDMAAPGDRAWVWDGQRAKEWPIDVSEPGASPAEALPLIRTVRQWFLSAGGDSLFCFENRFEQRPEKADSDSGPQRSVRGSARVWQTDLGGGRRHQIAAFPVSGWCRCKTGACSETCPAWEFWTPAGIVDDFFLATRVTPGQLQTTYHESLRYRRSGSTGHGSALPRAVERLLCASARGEAVIAGTLDGGCCGWENEGSDQLLLLRSGKVSVLYDEFARYSNHNYDVSIFPSSARVVPGGSMLAYTLASTAPAGGQIRLSSSGRSDAVESARVRTAIAGLPAVEILDLDGPSRPLSVIPRASLVGWLNDRDLLVVREGVLTVCDRSGQTKTATSIRVRTAADVFLR